MNKKKISKIYNNKMKVNNKYNQISKNYNSNKNNNNNLNRTIQSVHKLILPMKTIKMKNKNNKMKI